MAQLLARQGSRVIDLKAWAKETGAIVGHDDQDDADIIDLDELASRMAALPEDCFIEGHLAHLLPVDVAWVIRVDPHVLGPRLRTRGYADAKVVENLESEALDIILLEALDNVPLVVQRDATTRSPGELLESFAAATATLGHDIEDVDWTDRLPFT